MEILYNQQYPSDKPDLEKGVLFLAGPTYRGDNTHSWRWHALEILKELGFAGRVYVPEYHPLQRGLADWDNPDFYAKQCKWEHYGIWDCATVVFWIPRHLQLLPGFTTNIEFGYCVGASKAMVYGRPDGSPKCDYLDWMYRESFNREPFTDLKALLTEVTK